MATWIGDNGGIVVKNIGEVLYEMVKSFDSYNYRLITGVGTQEYGAVYQVTRK